MLCLLPIPAALKPFLLSPSQTFSPRGEVTGSWSFLDPKSSSADHVAQSRVTASKNVGRSLGAGKIPLSVLGLLCFSCMVYSISPIASLSPNLFHLGIHLKKAAAVVKAAVIWPHKDLEDLTLAFFSSFSRAVCHWNTGPDTFVKGTTWLSTERPGPASALFMVKITSFLTDI